MKQWFKCIAVMAMLTVAMGILSGCTQVKTESTGVVTVFGRPTGQTLDNGFHVLLNPFSTVHEMNNRMITTTGTIDCYSKDTQVITVEFSIQTRLLPSKSSEVFIKYGTDYFAQMRPKIIDRVKVAVGCTTAEEAVVNREKLTAKILSSCIEKLSDTMEICDVSVTDASYSDEYEKAVERKQVALQESLKAEYAQKQAIIEAKTAEIRATGEALAMDKVGEAIKRNPNLIWLEALKKWNGVPPQAIALGSGGSFTPLLQLAQNGLGNQPTHPRPSPIRPQK